MLAAIERIKAQADQYLLEQAQRGAKLVGYTYGFAPPELLRACGAVPVRLLHAGGYAAQHQGQQITENNTCTYCKAIVGSHDRFPFEQLALLVSDGLCEALRRAGEVWAVRFSRKLHTMSVPRVDNNYATDHYVDELHALQETVSTLCGLPFDEGALIQEISGANKVRALLRRINAFRTERPPRLLASELWTLATASLTLPAEDALKPLQHVLKQLEGRSPSKNRHKRLLLLGSFLAEDDRTLVGLVEQNGGHIASDGLSEGQGSFWSDIPSKNPWQALAQHALQGPWHIQRPHTALFDYVRAQVESEALCGIVYKTLEFCDPWALQAKRVKTAFQLPFLHIDSDYSPASREQLRTRVQAFLEML